MKRISSVGLTEEMDKSVFNTLRESKITPIGVIDQRGSPAFVFYFEDEKVTHAYDLLIPPYLHSQDHSSL